MRQQIELERFHPAGGRAAPAVAGMLALMATLVGSGVQPAASQHSDHSMISGGADLLLKGEEFGELLGRTLVYLLFAALEDSVYTSDPHRHHIGDFCHESDIEAAAIEVGTSLGFFVAPGLAVGGKMMFSSGDRHLGETARGGLGPEATLFFGGGGRRLTPYVGAALVYTRPLSARDDRFQKAGASVVTRAGVQTRLGPASGFYMQLTHNSSTRRSRAGERDTRWGLGLGYTGFF